MQWYDLFSFGYDRSVEALYRPYRPRVVDALQAAPGSALLDVACGTGQNFDLVRAAVGDEGWVVGVDRSKGMLRQARLRVARAGWTNVALVEADAQQLAPPAFGAAMPVGGFDGVVCTLGLSAMPAWEAAFERAFGLLRPGGRFVILDVHAGTRTLQTRLVELTARADLSREVWRPLERRCDDFRMDDLDAPAGVFGGRLFVAAGTRSGA